MELETKSNDTEETYRTRTDDVTGQAQQVFSSIYFCFCLIHLFFEILDPRDEGGSRGAAVQI